MESGAHQVWQEEGTYPGEPIFVPRPGGSQEDDGLLLSVVLAGQSCVNAWYHLSRDTRVCYRLSRVTCCYQLSRDACCLDSMLGSRLTDLTLSLSTSWS